MIILSVLKVLAVIAGLIVLIKVALIVFLCLFHDNYMKDKFGDNYDTAINSELTPLTCKPDFQMVSMGMIRKRTHIVFPPFKIISCVSLLRHFTGDYHERCEIQFSQAFDQEAIRTIRDSESWEQLPDDDESFLFSFEDSEKYTFWSMRVSFKELTAVIEYGAC